MIKSLVILALLVALLAAAFFTRPSEASYQQLVREKMTADAGNFFEKLLLDRRINGYLDDCEFHDRYLWVDVTRDRQTIYTGAFNHWFERGTDAKPQTAS